jgi:flagellar biosynthetic protein FliQ
MSEGMIIDLFTEAIKIILMLSAPMLLSGLFVGLIIAIFQATTQIQEATLAFVPKIITVFLVLIFTGGWLFTTLVRFSTEVLNMIDLIIY